MIRPVASYPAVDTLACLTIHNILYERKVKWHSPEALRMAVSRYRACCCKMSADIAAGRGRRRTGDRGARHQRRHA
jgi:hypothetical protein